MGRVAGGFVSGVLALGHGGLYAWSGGTYLWKTETQLRGPLYHLATYSWNFGFTDWRNGPMKGSFNGGPTMLPLFQM